MYNNILKVSSFLLILSMFNSFVFAHSGRTDKSGGHYDRKTGVYHYHNSGPVMPRVNTNTFDVNPNINAGVGRSGGQAVVNAERDAAADTNSVLWIGGTFVGTSVIGCLFCGLPTILVASIYQPTPPAARLMGKSPEYIMLYTQTYKEKVKSRQIRDATIGCIGGSIVAALVWGPYYASQY